MMQAARSWDDLKQTARSLERQLEVDITTLKDISKKLGVSSPACFDEENPSLEGQEEKSLIADIETALGRLSETIDDVNSYLQNSSTKVQEALLQRYREIYFDLKSDFRRSTAVIQEKRDAANLFGSRSNFGAASDSDVDTLLHERSKVESSRSLASTIIQQAMATKNSLETQRSRLTTSRGKMAVSTGSFSGIQNLVAGIRRKKLRNNTILALVIAVCICFTLWWTVLSSF
uniref:Uncharacterized protein AlNc14C5G723 n=1 Tax=Albugo laibachii Nc14 TaxID=890382 RepID=F0W0T8_9STRA|nr:conserved hypothetical protein [Albugo laibachii Nc14]|eukprot:CCA14662.1 conserved hypothetical protein [Albugo laibachii Nc14]